jgi:hypothetical protein
MHPIQQQGRRLPSASSVTDLLIWFSRVAAVLTLTLQQIHSLRASGEISSHAARALGLELRDFRKSSGNWWAVPPEIVLAMFL